MGGRDGQPRERGDEKGDGGADGGGKALVLLELHHLHAHLLDDATASDTRADGHDARTEHLEPEREATHVTNRLPHGEGDGEHGRGHELLTVLGTVHERHEGRTNHLETTEAHVKAASIRVSTGNLDKRGDGPACNETEHRREQKTVDDLDPLAPVDTAEATLDRKCGPREPGDECVTLARGNTKDPSAHTPGDDADRRCGERDERRMGVSTEVDHTRDGVGNGGGDESHNHKAYEVAEDAHYDGGVNTDGTRTDRLGDGVGRVGRTVHENGA